MSIKSLMDSSDRLTQDLFLEFRHLLKDDVVEHNTFEIATEIANSSTEEKKVLSRVLGSDVVELAILLNTQSETNQKLEEYSNKWRPHES